MTDVFSFNMNELQSIHRNRRDLERETKFLRERFVEWQIDDQSAIRLDEDSLSRIITLKALDPNLEIDSEENGGRLLVFWADRLGAIFKATGLSTSQVRIFFGEIRSIQNQGFSDPKARRHLILLIPKLRYAAAKNKSYGLDRMADVLIKAIGYVEDDPVNFNRFSQFFEAILAYHRAYGGN